MLAPESPREGDCPEEERHLLMASDSSLDTSLWISAHSDLLAHRQDEYMAISRDIEMLSEMYADVRGLIERQQEPIDRLERLVLDTSQITITAETELTKGANFQHSAFWLRAGLCLLAGTAVGTGIGGVSLLVGLKPLICLAVGSSSGLLTSGVLGMARIGGRIAA